MFLRETLCLFCLHPTAARLGLDRKSRPWTRCLACGTRAFIPLADVGLRGLAFVPSLVAAWRDGTSEAEQRATLAGYLDQLRLLARGAAAAAPPTAEQALTVALEKVA